MGYQTALRSIPKVLDNIEDIHKRSNSDTVLAEYKKSVKAFISTITAEVMQLIDKYQKKIKDLALENKLLKQQKYPFKEANSQSRSPRSNQFTRTASPNKVFKNLDMMQTAKSSLFNPCVADILDEGNRFSSVLAKYQNNDDHNFPLELINPEPGEDDHMQSRFQAKSNRKKQREEELRHFLQTGKKNMKNTTDRFLSAIGREPQVVIDDVFRRDVQRDHSGDSSQSIKRDGQSALNKSLGDVCESLNNSFVSRKARSQNKKKRDQVQEEVRMKQKRDEEITKMLREKGVKNLLQKLRDNVESSAKNPPEVIKSSKLISCGSGSSPRKVIVPSETVESPLRGKRNSKVLFNPVPVDIGSKSKILKKDSISSPLSPERKPQSILKQSSMVLSHSLSGISAIDFNT